MPGEPSLDDLNFNVSSQITQNTSPPRLDNKTKKNQY